MLRPPPKVQPPASVVSNPYFDQMKHPSMDPTYSGGYKSQYGERVRDEAVDRDYSSNTYKSSYDERMPRNDAIERDYPAYSGGYKSQYDERNTRDINNDIPRNSSSEYRKNNDTTELSDFEKDVMYEMMKLDAALKSELEQMEKNQSSNTAIERPLNNDVMMTRADSNPSYSSSGNSNKVPPNVAHQSVHQSPNNSHMSNVFNNNSPNLPDYNMNLNIARRKGSGINSLYKAPSEDGNSNSKLLYAQQLQQQIDEQKRLKSLENDNYDGNKSKGKHGEIIDYKYSPGYDPSTLPPPSASLLQDMYGMNSSSGGMVFGHDQSTEKSLRREKQDMYKKQLDEIVSTRDQFKQQYTPSSSDIALSDRHTSSRDQYKQQYTPSSVDNNITSADSADKAARRKQQHDYRLLLDQQVKSNKEMSEASRPYPSYDVPPSVTKANATPSPSKQPIYYDDRQSQSGLMHYNYDGGASISSDLDAEQHYHSMMESNHPAMLAAQDSGGKGSAKSPTKARLRLIADVYGSSGSAQVLGQNSAPANGLPSTWKPSGKNQDDRKKAAVLEQKAILENQIADTKRRKEEEARQLKLQDEELERRVRSELASVGEEERRVKEMKRLQMRDEINQAKAINEKAYADARARKGKVQENTGNVQNTPPRVLQMNQPVQNSPPIYSSVTKANHSMVQNSPPIYSSVTKANHSMVQNSPPARAVHPPPKVVSNETTSSHYYPPTTSNNNNNSSIQYMDQDYNRPNPLNTSIPNELSYSLSRQRSSLTMEPVYQQNQRSLLHSSNESLHNFRPNSAEQVDSFLVNWQSKNNSIGRGGAPYNVGGSYHVGGDLSMSASYRPSVFSGLEATDVSFVSESRLVSANPWDSVGLMSSLAPAPHKEATITANTHDVMNNRKKFTANDELEESLASDSLLMFIGDRTPLKGHVTVPPAATQVDNSITSPLSRLISDSKAVESRLSIDRPISARPASLNKPSPKGNKVNDSLDRIITNSNHSYSDFTEINEEESEIIVARNTSSTAIKSPDISRITPHKPSNFKVQTPTKEEYDVMNSTLTSPPRSPPRGITNSPGSAKSKYQSSVLNEYFSGNNRPISSTKSRWDTSDSTKEVTLNRLNHATSNDVGDEYDDEEAIQISYTSKGRDSVQDSYYQDTFEEEDA